MSHPPDFAATLAQTALSAARLFAYRARPQRSARRNSRCRSRCARRSPPGGPYGRIRNSLAALDHCRSRYNCQRFWPLLWLRDGRHSSGRARCRLAEQHLGPELRYHAHVAHRCVPRRNRALLGVRELLGLSASLGWWRCDWRYDVQLLWPRRRRPCSPCACRLGCRAPKASSARLLYRS
jgi:hypothetical protein